MPVFPALRMLKEEDPKSEKCMEIFLLLFFFFVCFVFLFFSTQGFSVQPWLSWAIHFVDQAGLLTQKSACLCLPSAGIKGMQHHCPAQQQVVLCVGSPLQLCFPIHDSSQPCLQFQGIRCPLLTSEDTTYPCGAHTYIQANTHTHKSKPLKTQANTNSGGSPSI